MWGNISTVPLVDCLNVLWQLNLILRCVSHPSLFLCLVIDIQAFERLLGSCKEIMKRNIAHYEEQLVALFGSSMDLRDWASHTTLRAFYYKHTYRQTDTQTCPFPHHAVAIETHKLYTDGANAWKCTWFTSRYINQSMNTHSITHTHSLISVGTERRSLKSAHPRAQPAQQTPC